MCFPRVAVWALRAQRIVDVTDVDQLARFVAIARVVLVRVSFPVDHDVVLVRHCRGKIETSSALDDQSCPRHGMRLHHLALLIGELTGLVENVLGNVHLAEVMQQTRDAECANVLLCQPERFG